MRSVFFEQTATDIGLRAWGSQGIRVRDHGCTTIAEEQPDAHKDMNEVVCVVHNPIAPNTCTAHALSAS